MTLAFAIALKAIDWQLNGAIKTAAFAFLAAWAVFAFVIYISNVWEKRRPWMLGAQIAGGLVLAFVWWAYLPKPPEPQIVRIPVPIPQPSPTPFIKLTIEEYRDGYVKGLPNELVAIVFVGVRNIGTAPSTANDFRLKLMVPEHETVYEGIPAQEFRDISFSPLNNRDVLTIKQEEAIEEKVSIHPVFPDGTVQRGIALFRFPGLREEVLVDGTIATLTCVDSLGFRRGTNYRLLKGIIGPFQHIPGIRSEKSLTKVKPKKGA